MVSGAVILSVPLITPVLYYKKQFKNLVFPLLIFSIAYFFYAEILNIARIVMQEASPSILLKPIFAFLEGRPFYHLWYMYMILLIYILVPILMLVKNYLGDKRFFHVSLLILIWGILSNQTSSYDTVWDIGLVFSYLGYFMAGYGIQQYVEKQKENSKRLDIVRRLFSVVFCLAIVFVLTTLQYGGYVFVDYNLSELKSTLSFFTAYPALQVFYLFSTVKLQYNFQQIVSKCYYIYLIHAGILEIYFMAIRIFHVFPNPFWGIIGVTTACFLISCFLASPLEKYVKYLERRLKII